MARFDRRLRQYANLTNADLSQANLTNASFGAANLTGASFRHANLSNASFQFVRGRVCGFDGSCFSVYDYATLTNSDLTGSDARGALGLQGHAATANLIRPDGHINGLHLDAGGLLVVRDYRNYFGTPTPFPIIVDQHLAMGPGGTLRMVFEADAWDSTISFAPGIPVTLGGTLELTFAADVNLASQVGRTFDLFDWTGVNPTGAFAVSSPYAWDLSNLYTTGEVTLTAVPEPGTLVAFQFRFECAHRDGPRTNRFIQRRKPMMPFTKTSNVKRDFVHPCLRGAPNLGTWLSGIARCNLDCSSSRSVRTAFVSRTPCWG